MKEDYEQVEMDGFMEEPQETMRAILTEVFQDPTPIADIKEGKFINGPLPEEVKKGRSRLIDGIISTPSGESGEISIADSEISDYSDLPVETRISLSFNKDESRGVSCSRVLTNFDREVIDAVSTLASNAQIMTAAMIYRVITGKDDSVAVSQPQKKRVEESMNRCAECRVVIDITSELKGNGGSSDNESLQYMGHAINYEAIKHQKGRGTTTYYKINTMPPFYRFAERLGKISVVPLRLLDSPVSKTDNIIAIQSYLLREIDSMKRAESKPRTIEWEIIYQMAIQEGKKESRQENKRTRDTIQKILDFWVTEEFIRGYQSPSRSGTIILEI